ncbi:hypothetical protein OE88DRAFT_1811983 [Heliocybe sulcata]|uniref:Uncharacterized protein n=1 Tax=Heliocybe sulcata TaxID=5364 RepID=A0A5C3MLY0_9AGAM|nr:hypothetical protein OE88DRAFT_1811983 [Heliocybe sulcata]
MSPASRTRGLDTPTSRKRSKAARPSSPRPTRTSSPILPPISKPKDPHPCLRTGTAPWRIPHRTCGSRPWSNPYSYGPQGSNAPEAQAFVLEMEAAYGDWTQSGSQGANSALGGRDVGVRVVWASVVALTTGFVVVW